MLAEDKLDMLNFHIQFCMIHMDLTFGLIYYHLGLLQKCMFIHNSFLAWGVIIYMLPGVLVSLWSRKNYPRVQYACSLFVTLLDHCVISDTFKPLLFPQASVIVYAQFLLLLSVSQDQSFLNKPKRSNICFLSFSIDLIEDTECFADKAPSLYHEISLGEHFTQVYLAW